MFIRSLTVYFYEMSFSIYYDPILGKMFWGVEWGGVSEISETPRLTFGYPELYFDEKFFILKYNYLNNSMGGVCWAHKVSFGYKQDLKIQKVSFWQPE